MASSHAATIDAAGRLVIPKAVRDELSIVGGDSLLVTVRDGRIEIEPVITPAHLVEIDGVAVITPYADVTPLDAEAVRAVLESIRR